MAKTKPKSARQVLDEIKKLTEMKPFVKQYSISGDDNHAKIEAQIHALKTMDDEGDADVEWPDESDNELRQCAVDAIEWKNGENLTVPSEDWSILDSRKKK